MERSGKLRSVADEVIGALLNKNYGFCLCSPVRRQTYFSVLLHQPVFLSKKSYASWLVCLMIQRVGIDRDHRWAATSKRLNRQTFIFYIVTNDPLVAVQAKRAGNIIGRQGSVCISSGPETARLVTSLRLRRFASSCSPRRDAV